MKPVTRIRQASSARSTEFVGRSLRVRRFDGFTIREVRDDPTSAVRRHTHALAHFCVLLDGGYTSGARGGERCARGTVLFHPPDTTHDDRFRARGGSFLTVTLTPECLRRLEEQSPVPEASLALSSPRVGWLVERIALENMRAGAGLVVESLLFELAGLVVAGERVPLVWLAPGLERLEDDPDVVPSVRELARCCDVHPVSLARAFRHHLGLSPGEYLRLVRIRRVLPHLARSRRPLVELASDAGYSDQTAFTRAFRRLLGLSPGRYRKLFADRRRPPS